jgi:hypothetical protein
MDDKVLVLKSVDKDMRSYNNFVWPREGVVRAPDWKDNFYPGYGLHGFLWGEGDGSFALWDPDAIWLVVSVLRKDIRAGRGGLIQKCKFPAGEVVFCGDRPAAIDFLVERLPNDRAYSVIGRTVIVGDHGTAIVGDHGTAAAGCHGTAITGDHGTAIVGDHGSATVGYHGNAIAGGRGTAIAGGRGTAITGNYGTAIVGDHGSATVGYHGNATVGDDGIATVGNKGIATAGDNGIIQIAYYDHNQRKRIAIGYVDEEGILSDTPYRVNQNGRFIKA